MEILLVLVVLAIGAAAAMMMIKRQAAKIVSVEEDKPQTTGPKHAPVQSDISSRKSEISAVDKKASGPAEIERQSLGEVLTAASPAQAVKPEKIPEDSTLKRHYLSAKQAEREAITNPYPTDSALKRHYESMSAATVNDSFSAEKTESHAHAVKQLAIPEDSTLRRHFLAQLQAEIESFTSPKPTDSTLKRHYDSQVKAKMDEYLSEAAM